MYEYKLAYRYKNNQVQGFVGHAFDKKLAEQQAYNKIYDKLEFLNERFDKKNVILSSKQTTNEELQLIRKDWKGVMA